MPEITETDVCALCNEPIHTANGGIWYHNLNRSRRCTNASAADDSNIDNLSLARAIPRRLIASTSNLLVPPNVIDDAIVAIANRLKSSISDLVSAYNVLSSNEEELRRAQENLRVYQEKVAQQRFILEVVIKRVWNELAELQKTSPSLPVETVSIVRDVEAQLGREA